MKAIQREREREREVVVTNSKTVGRCIPSVAVSLACPVSSAHTVYTMCLFAMHRLLYTSFFGESGV